MGEIVAQGIFVGSPSKLRKLLMPLKKAGSPTNFWINEVPYIKAAKFFDLPSGNEPALRKRSGSFIERPFPRKTITEMKELLANAPNNNASIWQQSLRGAVGRVP